MKPICKYIVLLLLAVGGIFALSSFLNKNITSLNAGKFPYRKAGLTERQAAAHLLSRFTYGATPGQVDEVVKQGLENWFVQQLQGGLADDSLNQLLDKFDALKLSNTEIVKQYPKQFQVVRMAIQDSVVDKDSVRADSKAYKEVLANYMQQKGLKPEQELYRQFINQKVLRAAYTHNQLQEVMTDFWFNHFNVSITKNDCSQFIPNYERDVIRPNALGKFNDLLLATAQSPAMLFYLDNFSSTAPNNNQPIRRQLMATLQNNMADTAQRRMVMNRLQKAKNVQGLNENYAREVMELHTLGVDGGYTQQDVTEAAKVLTGWTIYPMGTYGNQGGIKNLLDKVGDDGLAQRGFIHINDFLFTPTRHDKGEKMVLGQKFAPNGGYQEGVQLLSMLAHHPSTAKFISRKLAVRFVSDNPPQSLIDKMAKTFTEKDGDIKQVLMTMVSAPEFWNASALREKTKSPFELAIGSIRGLNAQINQPYQLFQWVIRMGEKKYYYQAPTGFPDKGQFWINTGSLLNRMNFGLALAAGRVPGVKVDLAALNNHHEPESAQSALLIYSKLIMPERDLSSTIKRLTPMLTDPELVAKVETASKQAKLAMVNAGDMSMVAAAVKADTTLKINKLTAKPVNNNAMLAQVVGVIIGSPEYQRR